MLNDPSKAFNCLLHELLVTQLNAALRLVKNYLTNCSQRTKINSDFSSQRRHFFLTPSIPLIESSVVVAERRRFFLMSFIPLIEILQNRFFQLYNCNNHTAINVDMDSQDNLNMTKVSNFTENRRNRKIHTKPDDRILEIFRYGYECPTITKQLPPFWDYPPYWSLLQRQLARKS